MRGGNARVRELLAGLTAPAELVRPEGEKKRCLACGHRCLIGEGAEGICRVRFVRDGVLRVPFGYVASLAADPIEKKPFFHVTPGAVALSFGMLGCDLRCPFCQNWEISQALRDPETDPYLRPREIAPAELVALARTSGASMVTSTYNEPLITSEWAGAVFREARAAGLLTSFVSNGNGCEEVVEYLRPLLSAVKIDLKGMTEGGYRRLGGRLSAVLETIRLFAESPVWLEVVTLVVPGQNDSEAELRDAARFLSGLRPGIPWHVTGFHPDYKEGSTPPTPPETLRRAREIGLEEGLLFVYTGNRPGLVPDGETTSCPACRERLVVRSGFRLISNRLLAGGLCPSCKAPIPGLWSRAAQSTQADPPGSAPLTPGSVSS